MERVLIATDGSSASNEAVEIGVQLARDEGAEAIFVHVVTMADMVAMNGFGLMGYVPNEPTDWDERMLDEARAVAERESVPARTAVPSYNLRAQAPRLEQRRPHWSRAMPHPRF